MSRKDNKVERRNKQVPITLIMTEMCNLACTYCYVCSQGKHLKASKEVMDKTVDFAINYLEENPNDSITIDIFGGEPLLAWEECKYFLTQIKERIVPYYGKRFICSTIFTNLTLLTREHMDWLTEFNGGTYFEGIARLSCSLDGSKEAHDKSRIYKNGKGTYDVIMEKIEILKEYMPPEGIFFKSVIAPENCEYILDSAITFRELGIKRVSMGPARTNSWDKESVEKFRKGIRELADYYIANINDGLFYDIFAIPILDYEKNKRQWGFCGAGKDMISISPEGDIYPCQRFYNSRSPYILGSVLTGGIDKNNKWFKLFNNYTLDNFVGCSKCKNFEHYNCPFGSCMATNYEENKNIFVKSDATCDTLAIVTQEAFRVHEALKDNEFYKRSLDWRKYGG